MVMVASLEAPALRAVPEKLWSGKGDKDVSDVLCGTDANDKKLSADKVRRLLNFSNSFLNQYTYEEPEKAEVEPAARARAATESFMLFFSLKCVRMGPKNSKRRWQIFEISWHANTYLHCWVCMANSFERSNEEMRDTHTQAHRQASKQTDLLLSRGAGAAVGRKKIRRLCTVRSNDTIHTTNIPPKKTV